jgi:hypothetical protein
MSSTFVIFLVILPSFVVFVGLPGHTEKEDKTKRSNSAGRIEGANQRNGLEDGTNEEVYVGISLELDN